MKLNILNILIIIAIGLTLSCEKREKNMVPFDYVNPDKSYNYHEVLKDIIKKERRDKLRYSKNDEFM